MRIRIFLIALVMLCVIGSWRFLSTHKDQVSVEASFGDATATPRAIVLSARPAVSAILIEGGRRVRWYERETGRVLESDVDGTSEKVVSPNNLANFLSTVWSPDGREVVSSFAGTNNTQRRSYYNFTTKTHQDLPGGLGAVAFSPSGDMIAYSYREQGNTSIILAKPDGSTPRTIATIRSIVAALAWTPRGIGLILGDIASRTAPFLLNDAGDLRTLGSEAYETSVRWDRTGTLALISRLNTDGTPSLTILNIDTGTETVLPLIAGAGECAWVSSDQVICRADGPDGGGLYRMGSGRQTAEFIKGSAPAKRGVLEIETDRSGAWVVFIGLDDGLLYTLQTS